MSAQFLLAVAQLERRRKLDRIKFEVEQGERFRRFARWVAERSPYYAEVVRAHRIDLRTCRVEDFPELSKAEVLQHFDRIVTDRELRQADLRRFLASTSDPHTLYRGHYRVVHTSGTSGTVGVYAYSPSDWMLGLLEFAMHKWRWIRRLDDVGRERRGWRPLRIAYLGATRGHFGGVTVALTSHSHWLLRRLLNVRLFDVGDPFSEVIAGLNAFQPDWLGSYAAQLVALAHASQRGELSIAPSLVESGAEVLSASDRELVQRAFGVPAVDVYGSSEHLIMGFVAPGDDAMSLCEDQLIFELRDDCTVVTNLWNRTVPLIRYRMEDVLEPLSEGHTIHPGFPGRRQVKGVKGGRREHVPYFRNDYGELDSISPNLLVEFQVEGLEAFQIQLIDERRFVFRAQAAGGQRVREAVEKALRDLLEMKRMSSVTFAVEPVQRIAPDPKTGKFRLILPPPAAVVSDSSIAAPAVLDDRAEDATGPLAT